MNQTVWLSGLVSRTAPCLWEGEVFWILVKKDFWIGSVFTQGNKMGQFRKYKDKDNLPNEYMDYMFVSMCVCLFMSYLTTNSVISLWNVVSSWRMLETPPCVDFIEKFICSLSSSKSFPCGFCVFARNHDVHLPIFNSKSSFEMPCLHSRQLG